MSFRSLTAAVRALQRTRPKRRAWFSVNSAAMRSMLDNNASRDDNATAPWLDRALDRLTWQPCCGYATDESMAAEPTALAALALLAHGRTATAGGAAAKALDALAQHQHSDGRLATAPEADAPGWPTALAVLAWHRAKAANLRSFDSEIAQGVEWLLSARGKPEPRSAQMGHDMSLVGWSWVTQTHSWIEPTAWAVLALKSHGLSAHPRVREAVRMLFDRQLPRGGFNYGNTVVLGQELRLHVQPSGLTLLALADEPEAGARLDRTCDALLPRLSPETASASLAYALLGLAALGRKPPSADAWLAAAALRAFDSRNAAWKLALLAWAAAPVSRSPSSVEPAV